MSVAAAGGAVSTQLHQPTAEQIRLAQLIDDKKHDRNEVQEIVGKILDVVTNSSVDDALLALYDCDYDCEKAVALLIEKGHEVASEWRTATNHKTSKKQQKTVTTKNGHGDVNENGQHQQRGNSMKLIFENQFFYFLSFFLSQMVRLLEVNLVDFSKMEVILNSSSSSSNSNNHHQMIIIIPNKDNEVVVVFEVVLVDIIEVVIVQLIEIINNNRHKTKI